MVVPYILLGLISILLLFWQISNLISILSGSLYVKSDRDIIRQVLKLAEVQKGDTFYDLGSGNGDVLIEASKLGVKAIGFEISPYYYILSKLRTWKYSNIEIRLQNIKNVDLSKADVVYVYLLPGFLEKLTSKFEQELKPSARLISIAFPIKKLKYKKINKITNHKVFVY